MKSEEKDELSNHFFRNELNETEEAHLKSILKQGGAECDEFLDQLYLNQQLVVIGKQIQNSQQTPQKNKIVIRFGRIAVAAIVVCGIFYFVLNSLKQSIPEERKPVLAKWVKLSDEQEVMTQVSRYIHPGHQKLPEGNYQLVFSNGTKVNLNQKAEIELIDEENMVLHYGNLLAEVSKETKSFSVRTPGAHVVDLGTVFGIQVDDNQDSNIYVKEGVVAVSSLDFENRQVIRMDQQIDVDSKGQFSPKRRYVEPLEQVIPEIKSMPDRMDLNWVHWSFDDDHQGMPKEKSTTSWEALPLRDNYLAMPKVCESPFGKGLRFDGKDDALVAAPKALAPVAERTVSCWIRIPMSHKTIYNQSFLSLDDGEQVLWEMVINQTQSEGQINALKVKIEDGFLTGQTNLADGRWHHLVMAFLDGDQSDVSTHILLYVDGILEKISSHRAQTKALRKTPRVQSLKFAVHPGRDKYFKGDFDELWVFDQALLPEEVIHLRDRNTPYSK